MRHVLVEAEGRIASGYGGDREWRRTFITNGSAGRDREKAREVMAKTREVAREGG